MERPERAGALLWSGRIPLGSSCDRRNRFRKSSCCSLQHSEEMKRKKARGWRGWGGGREGKSERQREGNRNKFLSNQFVSPLRRSAEEDKLLCLARSASSTAWNPFNREKHNDSTRKYRSRLSSGVDTCPEHTHAHTQTEIQHTPSSSI